MPNKSTNNRLLHLEKKLLSERRYAVKKHPMAFALLSTFGLVATFYGFEHIIDEIPFLTENPIILLSTGVITLLVTGALYKKLS